MQQSDSNLCYPTITRWSSKKHENSVEAQRAEQFIKQVKNQQDKS